MFEVARLLLRFLYAVKVSFHFVAFVCSCTECLRKVKTGIMKVFALVLFILMYVLIIAFPKRRPWFALSAAGLFLCFGIVPIEEFFTVINWNVLMMIAGTMVIVEYFIVSKMPNLLADVLLDKSKNVYFLVRHPRVNQYNSISIFVFKGQDQEANFVVGE